MKKLVAVLFLLLFTASSIYGQKTRYGQEPPYAKKGVDYPIKVHISGIHIRQYCTTQWGERYVSSCDDVLYADMILNGKKFELRGDWAYSNYQLHLLPGDYDARLLKANHQTDEFPINDVYEVLMPDKRVFRGTVTGISE
jgi:hypothetical protein